MGFENASDCPFKFMSRFDLKNKVREIFMNYQLALTELLNKISFVCETVDIWSIKRRSFMGISVHYVDPLSFELKSYALSCAEFESPHTNERITERLQLVHSQYGLTTSKIVAGVTDNAANFVKAMNEFGNGIDVLGINESEFEDASDNDFEFPEIQELALPNHFRCASHTLNLIATVDIAHAQKDPQYKTAYSRVFAKLNKIWSLTSRSGSNEVIRAILGSSLSRPVATRWNAMYNSVSEVLGKDPDKLALLMIKYDIEQFSQLERSFLSEYKTIMKSIADALNNLQSNCYYALFLPTLFKVKSDIDNFMHSRQIKSCKPLVKALNEGFQKRFGHYMDLNDERAAPGFIAAVIHPFFKIRWLDSLKTTENIEQIKRILFKASDAITTKDGSISTKTDVMLSESTTESKLISILMKYYLLIVNTNI